jgi:hypothetical protein
LTALTGGRGNSRCRGRWGCRARLSSGTIRWCGKSVSAFSAKLIGRRIGGFAFGTDADQWLPTVATETLVLRVGTATIVAVHNVPALVAGLFLWPMAINAMSDAPNRPRAQPGLTGGSVGEVLQAPSTCHETQLRRDELSIYSSTGEQSTTRNALRVTDHSTKSSRHEPSVTRLLTVHNYWNCLITEHSHAGLGGLNQSKGQQGKSERRTDSRLRDVPRQGHALLSA